MTDHVSVVPSQSDVDLIQSKNFVCPQCKEGFRYRRHYDKHVEGHRQNNCKHCEKLFTVRKKLADHLFDEHKIELKVTKYCCQYCDRRFAKKSSLHQHYRLHAEGRHLCLFCGIFFSNLTDYAKHEEKKHKYEKPLKCEKCEEKFSRRQQYLLHVKDHGKYKCLTCKASFSAQIKLTEHKRKGHKIEELEAMYACEVCQRSFHLRRALVLHQRIHKDEASFNCRDCGKKFNSRKSYTRHLNSAIHGGKEETKAREIGVFVCDFCGKVFKEKQALSLHVNRVHTERKPKECNYCDYKSTSQANLKRHIEFHSEDRNFICECCGTSFYTLNALKEHHLYVHSEERNFHCSECDKSFKRKSGLNRHLKSHSEKRPHECYCGQSYKRKSHLKRHKESSHGIISKSDKLCKLKNDGSGRLVKVMKEGAIDSSKETCYDSGTVSDEVVVNKAGDIEELPITSYDTFSPEKAKLVFSDLHSDKSVSNSDRPNSHIKLNLSNSLNLPQQYVEPKLVKEADCKDNLAPDNNLVSQVIGINSSRVETMASNVGLPSSAVSEEPSYSLSQGESACIENVYQCVEGISGEEVVSHLSHSEVAQFFQGMHTNVPVVDVLQVVGPENASTEEQMILLYLPSLPLVASNGGSK